MRTRWIVSVLALTLAAPLAAEEDGCSRDAGMTFRDCFNETYSRALAEMGDRLAKDAEKAVEKSATAAATPEIQGTSADFLSRLVSSLGFGELSQEEGSQTLSFNLTGANKSSTNSQQAVLKIVRRDAELFESFVKAIPEAVRAQRKETLEEQLEDFDDLELSLSVALEGKIRSRRYGRSFKAYAEQTQAVFEELTVDLQPNNAAMQRLLGTTQNLRVSVSQEVAPFHADDPAKAALVEQAVIAAARQEAADAQALRKGLVEGKYFKLADLVANQPQIHFQGSYRSRDDLVGPDEWLLKATYEHGIGNMNGLTRKCGPFPDKDCLEAFLDEKEGKIKSANRLSISAEYGESDDLKLELPDDDVLFELAAVRKTIGSLGWGRSISVDDKGADTSRIDLEAKYENVTGDEKRNNRFVATTTLSQNVMGGNVLSFAVVYANKPEYRGEVDEELSARVGLKFKLDKKSE